MSATFSVLLTNVQTKEMGGAVTSCVGSFDLETIFGRVASTDGQHVAWFTQSWFSADNHTRARALLTASSELDVVVEQLTDPATDPDFADRQYHFLRTDGVGVTWTGANAGAFASGISGQFGEWSFTAAGNILTSERVLTAIELDLRSSSGAIAHRLVNALEAVEALGEGDSRCTPLPGDSAFVAVLDASGELRVAHSVVDTQPQSALRKLRELVGDADLGSSNSEVTPPASTVTSSESRVPSTGANGSSTDSTTNGAAHPDSAPVSRASRASSCSLAQATLSRQVHGMTVLIALAFGWCLRRRTRAFRMRVGPAPQVAPRLPPTP